MVEGETFSTNTQVASYLSRTINGIAMTNVIGVIPATIHQYDLHSRLHNQARIPQNIIAWMQKSVATWIRLNIMLPVGLMFYGLL